MNDMKVRLIDLNINFLLYIIQISYVLMLNNFVSLFNTSVQVGIILNVSFFYSILLNLKNILFLKFLTLSDLTVSHYLGFVKEFILYYYILSYNLNLRYFLKKYLKKEDLNFSLCDIYLNSNWFERES